MTTKSNLPTHIKTTSSRYGDISYFESDQVIGKSLQEYGEWAQKEIDFLLSLIQHGDQVIDIGACYGTHTLAFSKKVGKAGLVQSIEANPLNFEVLKNNIIQNNLTNVNLENLAVSNEEGSVSITSSFLYNAGNPGAIPANFKNNQHHICESGEIFNVKIKRLDQFKFNRCSLIKIDAGKMEFQILEGASMLLDMFRPYVYAECISMSQGADMLKYMDAKRYASFFHCEEAYNPDNFKNNRINIFGDAREASIFFVPEETLHRLDINYINRYNLIPLKDLDDLVLGMLWKPQYKHEILAFTEAAGIIGTDFFLNASEQKILKEQIAKSEEQVQLLTAQINEFETSKSWNLLILLRKIREKIAPKNSFREHLLIKIRSLLFTRWKG